MRRLGAVYEELFTASSTRVDVRKKSAAGGEPNLTQSSAHASSAGTRTGSHSTSVGKRPSGQSSTVGRQEGHAERRPERTRTLARSDRQPKTSRQSSNGGFSEHAVRVGSGRYEARSLSTDQSSTFRAANEYCDISPTDLAGLRLESGNRNRVLEVLPDGIRTNSATDEVVFESALSMERPPSSSKTDLSKASSVKSSRKSPENAIFHSAQAGTSRALPFNVPSGTLTPPRAPITNESRPKQKRRAQSERSGTQNSTPLSRSSTGQRGRNVTRASSLRADAPPRLTGLFASRARLMAWPVGVTPRVLYAAETSNELDDGHGASGLSATLLCKMGARHRAWDVVRANERFSIRVVGWHGGDLGSTIGMGAGCRAVVYTVVDRDTEGGSGSAVVHNECNAVDVSGYHYVSERQGVAASSGAESGDYVRMTVGLWVGRGGDAEATDVTGEVRWRLLREGEADGNGGRRGRPGAILMRFGYYFFLDQPCATRLYTNTDTPEHVRLVGRRVGDGAIDEEFSRGLTYIVVRVAAD